MRRTVHGPGTLAARCNHTSRVRRWSESWYRIVRERLFSGVRLKVKPSPKNFGKVKVGTVKFATLTLINPARKGPPITFANPMAVFPPANPQEFKSVGTTCPSRLLANKKCKLTLQFA